MGASSGGAGTNKDKHHEKIIPKIKFQKQTTRRKTTSTFVMGAMAAAALPLAVASAQADEAAAPPPPPSRVNALVDLTMASHYLTPRGMDVSRQGMVFQPLILAFFNVYKSDSFLIAPRGGRHVELFRHEPASQQ